MVDKAPAKGAAPLEGGQTQVNWCEAWFRPALLKPLLKPVLKAPLKTRCERQSQSDSAIKPWSAQAGQRGSRSGGKASRVFHCPAGVWYFSPGVVRAIAWQPAVIAYCSSVALFSRALSA